MQPAALRVSFVLRSMGGQASSRAEAISRAIMDFSPAQLIHFSLKRPILRTRDQARTHRVLDDVIPFLRVIFIAAQTGVPMPRLPFPIRVGRALSEKPFPVAHPAVERDFQSARCAEK